MTDWYLEDVEQAARESPDGFFIPSAEERLARSCGDSVRLHFVLRDGSPDGPRAERMWVMVTERSEGSEGVRYQGMLINSPVYIRGLDAGSEIDFPPVHIAQTSLAPSHPDWLPIGEQGALVSAAALEPGRRACWAYRVAPGRDEDSGWRLFRGDESPEYVADSTTIRICNVYWLVDRDPTLRQIFHADVGAAFERATQDGDWARVEDSQAPRP